MAFVLAILSCQMAAITHTSATVRIGEALTESQLVPAQLFSTGASDCLALEAAGKEPLRLIDVMVWKYAGCLSCCLTFVQRAEKLLSILNKKRAL